MPVSVSVCTFVRYITAHRMRAYQPNNFHFDVMIHYANLPKPRFFHFTCSSLASPPFNARDTQTGHAVFLFNLVCFIFFQGILFQVEIKHVSHISIIIVVVTSLLLLLLFSLHLVADLKRGALLHTAPQCCWDFSYGT